jgi:hypothetical protein
VTEDNIGLKELKTTKLIFERYMLCWNMLC